MPKQTSLEPVLTALSKLIEDIDQTDATGPDVARKAQALAVLRNIKTLLVDFCQGGGGAESYYQFKFTQGGSAT